MTKHFFVTERIEGLSSSSNLHLRISKHIQSLLIMAAMTSPLLAEFVKKINAFYSIAFFILACILILIVNVWVKVVRLHRFSVSNSCATTMQIKQLDKPFGFGLILELIRAYRRHRYMEWWQMLAADLGYTFHYWILCQRTYVTADPENIKVIFSSSFDIFEHGPTRRAAGKPIVGNGIFVADGEAWSAARALLRPSFAKSQINDLNMLEHHFQNFLHVLPVDKELVDLQEMFKWLSQDVITDMLFGSSTESLMRSNDEEALAFSHACEYAQRVRELRS